MFLYNKLIYNCKDLPYLYNKESIIEFSNAVVDARTINYASILIIEKHNVCQELETVGK